MQRVEYLLGGKLMARYDSHNRKWLFVITVTGETREYGARTGEKIIELLHAVEGHGDIKGKVGLDDHPGVGSGAGSKLARKLSPR